MRHLQIVCYVSPNADGKPQGSWSMSTHFSPLRVLVVDDEPLISWSLAETLTECGDVVTKAATGAGTIRALAAARQPVDVVLLDYKLPDVHNLSLLATVRSLWPASRVILMSAYATPEIAKQALAMGACGVIMKPVDMRDVPALVHGVAISGRN